MLPRNASILLVLMICFAQNIPTHSFYYETESKIDVEISGKRILIKFKSNVDAGEQLKVISQKKDVLVLGSIQNLSFSQVLIVKMKNIVSLVDEYRKESFTTVYPYYKDWYDSIPDTKNKVKFNI